MLERMAEETVTAETGGDAASSFAALMAGAADAATDEAPYGYTKDRKTGEVRPKKSPGRAGVRNSPSLEDLKAAKEQTGTEQNEAEQPAGDRAPAPPQGKSKNRKLSDDGKPSPQVIPAFKEGVIAAGVNKLYRRTGKIVRVMDRDIGIAIIETTRKEDEEDVTVGEAWEELARVNPRIRRFLLKLIAGGAWGQVVAAHAPILMAIVMKDAIARHIPFMALIEAFLGEDEDGPSEVSEALGGLQPVDMVQMMQMAQQMMGQAAAGVPRGAGPTRMTYVPNE